MVKKGVYKHFKGSMYRVIGTAKHSETLEEMVVYCKLNDSEDLWVRPMTLFTETVFVDGRQISRFEFQNA